MKAPKTFQAFQGVFLKVAPRYTNEDLLHDARWLLKDAASDDAALTKLFLVTAAVGLLERIK